MCHKDTARSPRISDLEWICLPDTVETETGDGGGDALNTPLVQPIDDVALHVGPVPVDTGQLHPGPRAEIFSVSKYFHY